MTRHVLVTGATRGIGLATVQWLKERNYHVVGIAREVPRSSFPGSLFVCDVNDFEQTQHIFDKIAKEFPIDVVVNNVGTNIPQPLGQIDFEVYQMIMNVNLRCAIQAAQVFSQGMKGRNWGRIVNIASRAIFGSVNRTVYSAAKSALVGCTRTWALELASSGITVNAVSPGPIETELFRKTRPKGGPEEKEVLAEIPMKRLGHPSEVAALIGFLLSEEAGYITGQTICIDGGGSL